MQTATMTLALVTARPWWECDWTPGGNRKLLNRPHVDYLGDGHRIIGSAGPAPEQGAFFELVRAAEKQLKKLADADQVRKAKLADADQVRKAKLADADQVRKAKLAAIQREERAKRLHARYGDLKHAVGLAAFDVLCEAEDIERYELMDLLRLGREITEAPLIVEKASA